VGDDVSVNIILGMPFIKAARLVIDSHDNVVESKLLMAEPFPIDYRAPSRSAPSLQPKSNGASKNLNVIKDFLEMAQSFMSEYKGCNDGITETNEAVSSPTIEYHPRKRSNLVKGW
jgi:hypothetical protein